MKNNNDNRSFNKKSYNPNHKYRKHELFTHVVFTDDMLKKLGPLKEMKKTWTDVNED